MRDVHVQCWLYYNTGFDEKEKEEEENGIVSGGQSVGCELHASAFDA